MKTRTLSGIVIAAAVLVACDQATITVQWDSPLPLMRDESPEGIYFGTLTDTSGAAPRVWPVTAMIDPHGNTQLIFETAAERHVAGRVDVLGDSVQGTLTGYAGALASFMGIRSTSEFSMQGTVTGGVSIEGEYDAGAESGPIVLDYQVLAGATPSLELTAGVWTYTETFPRGLDYTVTWEIADDGTIFGTDTLGCVFVGRVHVRDERGDAFDLDVQVGACGYLNGDYSGQGFLQSVAGPGLDRMTVAVSNDIRAFAARLRR